MLGLVIRMELQGLVTATQEIRLGGSNRKEIYNSVLGNRHQAIPTFTQPRRRL